MTDIDILCEEYNQKVEQSRREGKQEGREEACKAVGSSLAEYNEAKQQKQ